MIHSRSCGTRQTGAVRLIYRRFRRQEHAMLDIVLIALGLGFFVLSVAYSYVCERL